MARSSKGKNRRTSSPGAPIPPRLDRRKLEDATQGGAAASGAADDRPAIHVARPLESLDVRCPACGAAHQVLGRLPDAVEPQQLGFECRGCHTTMSLTGGVARRAESEP